MFTKINHITYITVVFLLKLIITSSGLSRIQGTSRGDNVALATKGLSRVVENSKENINRRVTAGVKMSIDALVGGNMFGTYKSSDSSVQDYRDNPLKEIVKSNQSMALKNISKSESLNFDSKDNSETAHIHIYTGWFVSLC